MEALVTIIEVGAYSERQYQRQDGTAEYFKSRGFVLKRGGDSFYGELTGEAARVVALCSNVEEIPSMASSRVRLPARTATRSMTNRCPTS